MCAVDVLNRAGKWHDNFQFLFHLVLFEKTGGDCMPPRGVESDKRKHQYEHIKESELKRGASQEDAERIAAATTNKTIKEKKETES